MAVNFLCDLHLGLTSSIHARSLTSIYHKIHDISPLSVASDLRIKKALLFSSILLHILAKVAQQSFPFSLSFFLVISF